MADQRKDDNNKEDGATTPPSENLKQTTISDKEPVMEEALGASAETAPQDAKSQEVERTKTPEPAGSSQPGDSEMKEMIASPKKKRGREVDDDVREIEDDTKLEEIAANGTATNGGRTVRSAPEKKRPRDTSEDPSNLEDSPPEKKPSSSTEETDDKVASSKSDSTDAAPTKPSQPIFGSSSSDKAQTSSSAFAASGFGALASKPSGFAALGGAKSSVFGGGNTMTAPSSGFGALAASKSASTESAAPLSGFGSLAAQKPGNALGSAFGTTASSFGTVGGGFGGGFGSGFAAPAGQKLSSFASSTKPELVGAEKPPKAFGAPESDADDGSDDDESDGVTGSDDDESASVNAEEKKKQKLAKVPLNDGEEGEATLLQFRAKLFAIESKEKGWKERGVGTLKLNVPKSYVDYDHNGLPIPGSFDPSGAEDREDDDGNLLPEPVAARLVMRQENTHRVILNTVIIKALKFEEKPSNTAVQILFTAFEETKPVNMLLKMSEANARLFTSEISTIQHEL